MSGCLLIRALLHCCKCCLVLLLLHWCHCTQHNTLDVDGRLLTLLAYRGLLHVCATMQEQSRAVLLYTVVMLCWWVGTPWEYRSASFVSTMSTAYRTYFPGALV